MGDQNIDGEIFGKAQEAHGQNVVFFSALAAIAYAWFGTHNIGWWWPLVWFGSGIVLALATGVLLMPFMREAARTPKRGWLMALGLPVIMTRPIWIAALSWFSFDQIAARWLIG